MASDIDFVELYRELGLPMDCSQEALTLAYRRRVAELHPDRHGEGADTTRLRRLNQLYQAALEFHRAHGHPPGVRPAPPPQPAPTTAYVAPPADHGSGRGARALSWLVVLSAAAMLLPGWLETAPAPATGGPDAGPDPGPAAPTDGTGIRAGSTTEQVLAAEGPPLAGDDVHWEYGPSWVRFHCGRVVAWHSSALRPLHIDGGEADARKAAVGEPGECGEKGEE